MKRMLIAALAMLLWVQILPFSQAKAVSSMMELPLVDDMALGDGRLYLVAQDALYEWNTSTEEVQRVYAFKRFEAFSEGDLLFDRIAWKDGQLYAYDSGSATLTPIAPWDGKLNPGKSIRLDLRGYESPADHARFVPPIRILPQAGKLFLLMPTVREGDGNLISFDLREGTHGETSLQHVIDFCPDGESGLLLLKTDRQGAQGGGRGAGRVERLEPATGAIETYDALGHTVGTGSRIHWDEHARALLYSDAEGLVYQRRQGKEELLARMDLDAEGKAGGLFLRLPHEDGLWVLQEGRMRRLAVGKSAGSPLTVYGVKNRLQQHQAASVRLQGVATAVADMDYGEQALAQALLLEPDKLDVLLLQMDLLDVRRLIAKGWLMDLSLDPALRKLAQAAHPDLLAACMEDDRLYAVPVELFVRIWFADSVALKAAGKEAPRSFEELCRLSLDCLDKPEDGYLPYQLMNARTYREDLMLKALQLYIQQQFASSTGEPRFNTELFRNMMAAAERLPKGVGEEIVKPRYLLRDAMQGYSIVRRSSEMAAEGQRWEPLLLSLDAATEPEPWASGLLIAVNARSKQPDQALKYLHAFLEQRSPEALAMLSPEGAAPVENKDHAATREQDLQLLQTIEREAEQSEGVRKTEMERMAQGIRQRMEASAAGDRYLISPEALTEYLQLFPSVRLQGYEVNSLLTNRELFGLYRRLAAGQMNIEHFIREADGILRLIRLESR